MYPSPFVSPTATLIDDTFIDDFLCDIDGMNGWSNCNHINYKYHGPLNNDISNIIYRSFKCNGHSLEAEISFSLAFDCSAFGDEIQLLINDKEISHYSPFPFENKTYDQSLLSVSSNCDVWFIRHIIYSLSLQNNDPFQLKFIAYLESNVENIVIYDISIQCVIQPTNSPSFVLFYVNIILRNYLFLFSS